MRYRVSLLALSAATTSLMLSGAVGAEASAPSVPSTRQPGSVVLESHDRHGLRPNANSAAPAISADGRITAYISYATDLVPGHTLSIQVFAWDAETDTNRLVTKGYDGSPANGGTYTRPSISGDGRYVAYSSSASNLVADDKNPNNDVFITDLETGGTQLVSKSTTGGAANDASLSPRISGDGKFVTYASDATNLVANDANGHVRDIFLFNVATGQTTLITQNATGGATDHNSFLPAISADGAVIVYESLATDLVAGDTNRQSDVFAYDVSAGTTAIISVGMGGSPANGPSYEPTLSGDGHLVSFSSAASNLVAHDNNAALDVFMGNRSTGAVTVLSATPAGHTGNDRSYYGAVSANGKSATFVSEATNLGIHARHHIAEVYEVNLATLSKTIVSVGANGKPGNRDSDGTAISADGRYVAFSSAARNLAELDYRKGDDVFLYSR